MDYLVNVVLGWLLLLLAILVFKEDLFVLEHGVLRFDIISFLLVWQEYELLSRVDCVWIIWISWHETLDLMIQSIISVSHLLLVVALVINLHRQLLFLILKLLQV